MEQTLGTSLEPTDKKKLNKATILMACITVLALGAAITFGVLWAVEKNQPKVVSDTTTTNCQTTTPDNNQQEATTTADANYIYIGQWGIKVKIPENLKNLHYSYQSEGLDRFEYSDGTIKIFNHNSSVGISGTDGESDDGISPDFVSDNKDNLGDIIRYEVGSYDCNASCPAYVTTIGDYEYYYSHPQAVATRDQSMLEWETASVELIKNMLSDANNYSKF